MTRRMWLLAMLVALLVPGALQAQEAEGPVPDRAAFAVRVIEASKGPAPKMDPRLGDLARELQTFQRDYNQFAVVSQQVLQLNVGGRGAVKLPGGAEFAISLLGFTPGKVHRARHQVEMPGTRMTRSMAPGGRTLDVLPAGDRLTIVSTTVEKAP